MIMTTIMTAIMTMMMMMMMMMMAFRLPWRISFASTVAEECPAASKLIAGISPLNLRAHDLRSYWK